METLIETEVNRHNYTERQLEKLMSPEDLKRSIIVYEYKWSEADIEHGEPGQSEEFQVYDLVPDSWDLDDANDLGVNVRVLLAMNILFNTVEHSSSSHFHPGTWYSSSDKECLEVWSVDTDTVTLEYTYHLKGFTDEEQKIIYDKLAV